MLYYINIVLFLYDKDIKKLFFRTFSGFFNLFLRLPAFKDGCLPHIGSTDDEEKKIYSAPGAANGQENRVYTISGGEG